MVSLIGQSIGRYHILEQLGEGGMATVYKAYDTRLERNVAVKVLRTDQFIPAQLQMVLQRFEREAKSLAKLTHPNIVHVLDFGEYEGAPYLVMEYLPGGTLKQKLRQAFPWQEAVKDLLPVAQCLAYAHQHGIIHRDVKPANILINENGAPILTDFGIAKLLESTDGQTLTGSGVGLGTPEYMAPEQGLGARTVDGRADVYALGIVLYEMITGRKPYIADTPMAVVIKQINDPLPRAIDYVPDLPETVEYVLIKALAKKPDDRFQSMDEFVQALEKLIQGEQGFLEERIEIIPKKDGEPIQRKHKSRWILVSVSILGFVSFGIWLAMGTKISFSESLFPINSSKVPTSTPPITPSPTITVTATPTPTLTRTPRPTATKTPIPDWVTNFAEPILNAIKDREPYFQDDFGPNTKGWMSGYPNLPISIGEGALRLKQGGFVENIFLRNKPNFVLQVDISQPTSCCVHVEISGDNSIYLGAEGWGICRPIWTDCTNYLKAYYEKIRIIIIVKNSRAGFYVNGNPSFYFEDSALADIGEFGNVGFKCGNEFCEFDNVKFWSLDNISNLP